MKKELKELLQEVDNLHGDNIKERVKQLIQLKIDGKEYLNVDPWSRGFYIKK